MSEQRLQRQSESEAQPVFFAEQETRKQLRVSEWLAEPPAPSSLVKRVKRLPWATIRAVASIACVVGLLGVVAYLARFNIFVFSGAFPGAIGLIWYRARYRGGSEAVRDLMDFPPVVEQYPVEVAYLRDGAQYGADVGVASFDGGCLHFQGRKSWFDFASSDTLSFSQDMSRHKQLRGFRRYHLKAREAYDVQAAPKWEVRLIPFDEVEKGESGYRARFDTAISAWMKPDEGRRWTSVLPPAAPRLETVAAAERTLLYGRVLLAFLLGGWLSGLATYQLWIGDSMFRAIAFAALLIPIVFLGLKLRGAGRHVRDLWRLAQPSEQ